MGSNPSPFFANLFLYFYESKWMNELKKNDDGKIESNNCNIYPEDRRGGSERSILTQDWTEKVFNGTCMHLHMPY